MAEGGAWFDDEIGPNLERYSGPEGVLETLEEFSGEVLAYAKDNAPWEDRTGEAREGLDVEVYEEGDELILELFHTVDYGLWLEVVQNGRNAIIMPTLEVFASQIFEATGAVTVGGY